MIGRLFERKASYEADVLAEAQALVDDGLELDFVLGLFPDEAEWLEPMLAVSESVETAFEGEAASYYFEASLKSKFLRAAEDPRPVVPVVIPAPAFSPFRTAVATMSVASAAAVVGVLSLGFITAEDSVPGDWNYTFKLANERFEYTLSRGDHRIDVQLKQAEARVFEVNKLSQRGDVSASQLERIQREWDQLRQISQNQELDALRKAQIESARKSAVAVVNDVATKQRELVVPAEAVAAAIDDTVTVLVAPSPTPAASPTASTEPTAMPSPTPTETPTPTPSPSATPSPTPAETRTATPSATGTASPSASETAAPGTATP